jgi:hypothetical protein
MGKRLTCAQEFFHAGDDALMGWGGSDSYPPSMATGEAYMVTSEILVPGIVPLRRVRIVWKTLTKHLDFSVNISSEISHIDGCDRFTCGCGTASRESVCVVGFWVALRAGVDLQRMSAAS